MSDDEGDDLDASDDSDDDHYEMCYIDSFFFSSSEAFWSGMLESSGLFFNVPLPPNRGYDTGSGGRLHDLYVMTYMSCREDP